VQDDFGECLAAPIQVTKEAVVKCANRVPWHPISPRLLLMVIPLCRTCW
jgi:hypothetical protein